MNHKKNLLSNHLFVGNFTGFFIRVSIYLGMLVLEQELLLVCAEACGLGLVSGSRQHMPDRAL